MGTSASSDGPGGGVPMVPPWVPDPAPPNPLQDGDGAAAPADGDGQQAPPAPTQPNPQQPTQAQPAAIAPAGRFGGARLNLGKFAREGKQRDLRRSLGQYVRKGYGGRETAVKRLGFGEQRNRKPA
jgi:hypothetical protein